MLAVFWRSVSFFFFFSFIFISWRLITLQYYSGEVFHYKLNGYKISKTHLSWTLNADLRGLSFKPQAVGATKSFSMVKERLLWMIAMVLSSLRMYKISSVLLI